VVGLASPATIGATNNIDTNNKNNIAFFISLSPFYLIRIPKAPDFLPFTQFDVLFKAFIRLPLEESGKKWGK
jgi:hypothetical protein